MLVLAAISINNILAAVGIVQVLVLIVDPRSLRAGLDVIDQFDCCRTHEPVVGRIRPGTRNEAEDEGRGVAIEAEHVAAERSGLGRDGGNNGLVGQRPDYIGNVTEFGGRGFPEFVPIIKEVEIVSKGGDTVELSVKEKCQFRFFWDLLDAWNHAK